MHDVLKQAVVKALNALDIEGVEPAIEFPGELAHGDFATNAALASSQAAGMNPRELAEKIVAELGEIKNVEKIEIAGPGFINFHLSRDYFSKTVSAVDKQWGSNKDLKGQKIMVEFSQPNPFKPFHIGHLMSTAIGESFARFAEFSGAKVIRANWQGDVGPHVARALWGRMQKPELNWGDAYVYGTAHYEDNKEEIDAINKKIYEKSDPELQKLYGAGRSETLESFEVLYKLLNTRFDYYYFEGTHGLEGVPIVKEGVKKNIFEESDGAVIFPGENHGLHTRVFLTSQGLPTYETKEIGLNKAKFDDEPDLDHSIIVTANEQSEYFKVVLKAISMVLPEVGAKTEHIAHGMMLLTSGKMSSRKGNVITGESLINDMRGMALEKMSGRELGDKTQAAADAVGVGAIKYAVLKQNLGRNISFDPEQSLSFEGDSGVYLQYSYARARSVLEKAGSEGSTELALELTPEFERLLPRFPAVVKRAAKEYEPHYVTTYLTELASAFNSWYGNNKIIGTEMQAYKLALVSAFAQTMENGLWLLGIEAPEKM